MTVKRVAPDLTSDRLDESRGFYPGLPGFQVAMDMDRVVTLASPDSPMAQISLVRGERVAPSNDNITLTVEVGDVDAVQAEAVSRGLPILYPLTHEPWGVRRFHLKDPSGVVINVMSHRE